MQERMERLEKASRNAERRARGWQLAAGLLVALELLLLPLQSGTAQGGQAQPGGLPALEKRVAALDATLGNQASQLAALQAQNATQATQIAALQDKLVHVSRVGADLFITGANLHLRNGLGSTLTTNALGNLIIGYNEPFAPFLNYERTGSHNLVVGSRQGWSSFGGLVVGQSNQITGPFASVGGGTGVVQEALYGWAAGSNGPLVSGSFRSL